ncbi:MAG: Wzz/FepE/Etk N-terminal domain-containing protein, partial [Planctomycetota bacterium]
MLQPVHTQPDPTARSVQAALRFLRVVWHRRIIVLGSLVVCGLLGGLYHFTATPIFEADAQILVVDSNRESLSTSLTIGSDVAAMATYEKLLMSPLVLQSAARLLEAPTRAVMGSQDPDVVAGVIAKGLKAKGIRQTNLLELK